MDPLQWMGAVRMRVQKNQTKSIKVFNCKPALLAKICIHNNASSSGKSPSPVVRSHQNPLKYLFTAIFWIIFAYELCFIIDRWLFSWKQWFEVNKNLDEFVHANMQLFDLLDVNWWTVWITCGLLWLFFISCLDSHSDGTHSLQRILHMFINAFKCIFSQGISWAVAHVGNVGLNWFQFILVKCFKSSPKNKRHLSQIGSVD